MPEPTLTCPRCGTALSAGAAPDQCPKCLLEVGLGSQPAAPHAQPHPNKPAPPSPAELARHFPQLEIFELLGQGGMGIVYKARQTRLDRLVALKILPADPARDPAFAERFTREARALARLNHPNIVAVYDFGETDGIYYFLMEYVEGLNLRQLERSGALVTGQALQIVPALCDALQYAHNLGVVHRDIKPENVLIDKQGRTKIADFGLAKLLGQVGAEPAHLTQEQQVMGTMNYMAPEQLERPLEVDHRADIYSLGVVFYEMLTGELPIGRFAPPSKKVAIDVRLDEVVLRALEKERELRYQQASEVKTDLENLSAFPAPPRTSPPSEETARWIQAHRAVKGPAIGLIGVGILNWLFSPITTYFFLSADAPGFSPILAIAITVLTGAFLIFAGLKMKALEARGAALAASILAMIIFPANLIGLPVGLWALVTLTRRQIRNEFGKGPPTLLPPPKPSGRKWLIGAAAAVFVALGLLVFLTVGALFVGFALPAYQKAKYAEQQAKTVGQAALEAQLLRSITEQLRSSYDLNATRLSLEPALDGGVLSFSGVSKDSATPVNGALGLRRLDDGSWEGQGRPPHQRLQFVVQLSPDQRTNSLNAIP